ncbi:MAG: hypothetical protein Q9217_001246 [Psora testacea]
MPTHITIHPPNDSRKRAVEKFAFTKVFEEPAEQIDIFKGTGLRPLIEGVLGEGRDGLVATLGVTGSGKSHTILGSRSQRGLVQLSLDLVYRSLDTKVLQPANSPSLIVSLSATDPSESQILSAHTFLGNVYGDAIHSQNASRAQTPMVGNLSYITPNVPHFVDPKCHLSMLRLVANSARLSSTQTIRLVGRTSTQMSEISRNGTLSQPSCPPFWKTPTPMVTRNQAKVRFGIVQDPTNTPSVPKRKLPQRPSAVPQFPNISDLTISTGSNMEYAILVSMYEVYNDRIFDLLSIPSNQKDLRRRALLFKPTEASPDRKVVAGLRKIVCGSYEEALMVLETGLIERRVAGTGSNSVSSRSHGFFCVEVKKRPRGGGVANAWSGAQLTVVDLAGSERARNAKTAGATLAEAGKINESLMYLGQCLQMQSDSQEGTKPPLVPFRQCKLTELLFSNSFSSANHTYHPTHHSLPHRNPQRAIMIVTADPLGDFNATSQILRYSALAREVTVPRIPSVSSTILAGVPNRVPSGRASPAGTANGVQVDDGVVEMAFSEIARLNEEVELLKLRLAEEESRRREAQENWQRAEDKVEVIEMDTREECWSEMEKRVDEERRRWKGAWGEEADRNDEHLDRKLEILSKSIQVHEDPVDQAAYQNQLETENERLRQKVEALERELQCQSPTKSPIKPSKPMMPNLDSGSAVVLDRALLKGNGMSSSQQPSGTAAKKMRKLTARKWDLMDENEMDAYENF